MDRSRHRSRLTRPRRRARYPSRMRLSKLFFTTLRDDPADAEMPSHRLLVRAGYVRQLGSGIYSLLPLGKRVNDRVEQVIREEQNAIGGQEMEMPVVHPADIWRASGRYDAIGPGADPVQGPQRTRHGPGHDPRGGRRPAARRRHPLVAAVAAAGLSLPDQVARRAARPWRAHPGPRVRDEGRLQRRSGSGRARRQLRGAVRRLRPDLRAARSRNRRRRLRRRDHGWQPGPRVHGPQPGRRGRPRAVRDRDTTPRTARSR